LLGLNKFFANMLLTRPRPLCICSTRAFVSGTRINAALKALIPGGEGFLGDGFTKRRMDNIKSESAMTLLVRELRICLSCVTPKA
jgi:hypothetical protein